MQFDLKQPRENETFQFRAGSSKGAKPLSFLGPGGLGTWPLVLKAPHEDKATSSWALLKASMHIQAEGARTGLFKPGNLEMQTRVQRVSGWELRLHCNTRAGDAMPLAHRPL